MAKLGEFQTPTGAKGSIFNPMDLLSLLLGVVVLIFAIAMGQNVANKMGNKVPGFDSSIEQPWKSDQQVVQARPQKTRVVY